MADNLEQEGKKKGREEAEQSKALDTLTDHVRHLQMLLPPRSSSAFHTRQGGSYSIYWAVHLCVWQVEEKELDSSKAQQAMASLSAAQAKQEAQRSR